MSQNHLLLGCVHTAAIKSGQLACVDFLTRHGCLINPYLPSPYYPVTPPRFKCFERMLDGGVAFHPKNVMMAAENGDLDCLRLLHRHGHPLWDRIEERSQLHDGLCNLCGRTLEVPWDNCCNVGGRTLVIKTGSLEIVWKALRYGAVHGAPVTWELWRLVGMKRLRTRAVLCCFKAAVRLCEGPGSPQQLGDWAVMAALPPELVRKILIAADLEIWDTMLPRPRYGKGEQLDRKVEDDK